MQGNTKYQVCIELISGCGDGLEFLIVSIDTSVASGQANSSQKEELHSLKMTNANLKYYIIAFAQLIPNITQCKYIALMG